MDVISGVSRENQNQMMVASTRSHVADWGSLGVEFNEEDPPSKFNWGA